MGQGQVGLGEREPWNLRVDSFMFEPLTLLMNCSVALQALQSRMELLFGKHQLTFKFVGLTLFVHHSILPLALKWEV